MPTTSIFRIVATPKHLYGENKHFCEQKYRLISFAWLFEQFVYWLNYTHSTFHIHTSVCHFQEHSQVGMVRSGSFHLVKTQNSHKLARNKLQCLCCIHYQICLNSRLIRRYVCEPPWLTVNISWMQVQAIEIIIMFEHVQLYIHNYYNAAIQ